MQSTKILVGVCTYQRPQMLKNCLQHIAAMEMDADQEVVCFVVNNDSEPIASEIVETFSASSDGVTFKFADCKERGIPQARNVILEYADNSNFDFCAFLDDDEYPKKDWLKELVKYQVASNDDAIQGEVLNVYEAKPWIVEPLLHDVKFGKEEGHVPRVVSTCNVLMTRSLYASDAKFLRFDPSLALTGGSDKELFNRARETFGIKVSFTPKACVYETISASRTSLRWFFQRFARIESNAFIFKAKKGSHLKAIFTMLPRAIRNFLNILFYTITIALTFYVPNMRRRKTIKLVRYSARFWGYISSATGNHINPYQTTTGS